jgi:hypothetical protein
MIDIPTGSERSDSLPIDKHLNAERVFTIYARECGDLPTWDKMEVEVVDGRAMFTVDGNLMTLTRIQTEALGRWLTIKAPWRTTR